MNRRSFFLGVLGCAAAPVVAALPIPAQKLVIKGLTPDQIRALFAPMIAATPRMQCGDTDGELWVGGGGDASETRTIYIENSRNNLDVRAIHDSLFGRTP